jgi:hypothetical protein
MTWARMGAAWRHFGPSKLTLEFHDDFYDHQLNAGDSIEMRTTGGRRVSGVSMRSSH